LRGGYKNNETLYLGSIESVYAYLVMVGFLYVYEFSLPCMGCTRCHPTTRGV
jgi:hypothetical protein